MFSRACHQNTRRGRACVRLLVLLGLLTAVQPAPSGDILRGGAPANQRNPGELQGGAPGTSQATQQARANMQDAMSRTSQAIQAVRSMQEAARRLAATGNRPPNLGADPNRPGFQLPNVPEGLAPGGLQVRSGGVWRGANLPMQALGSGITRVTIRQTEQQALLDWQTFNVGRRTHVHFDQSAGGAAVGQWIAFNRITDPSGSPSQIMGSITAPGQVYLINSNGILFGAGSQVNVRSLVASSLPINENLIARGLLNNPDAQFLFSALPQAAGTRGPTPGFTPPPLPASGRIGDVVVQTGAQISSPTTAANVGGRVILVGANVRNEGSITTPDGQTILAAGLQVGFAAHSSSDPSLRGLDVFVGAVAETAAVTTPYAGTVTNTGIISAPRGNISLAGKTIRHTGAIESTTSATLNGRVDIDASYGAVSNTAFKPVERPTDKPFLLRSTGTVELGPRSVIRILPEYGSDARVPGTELALRSQVNIRGRAIYLAPQSVVFAPNAKITVSAGVWDFVQTADLGTNTFVRSGGQIYLDRGALINAAGTPDAASRLADYILTLQLRGAELAGSPLQRNSIFRTPGVEGPSITVDLRRTGVYNGFRWVGTPLADLSGYLGLIQRTVAELTVAGGSVTLDAGGSVVIQPGSRIDVSGGWQNFDGGMVKATRVLYAGHLFDIADAFPDRVYQGIFTGQFTVNHPRWGITRTYTVPFMDRSYYNAPYLHGADGGQLGIAAPSVALDGSFLGRTVIGPRQWRSDVENVPASLADRAVGRRWAMVEAGGTQLNTELPAPSEFRLSLTAQEFLTGIYPEISPTPPTVIFSEGSLRPAGAFALDSSGRPLDLRADRLSTVLLAPSLFTAGGFGKITVENPDGRVIIPREVDLVAPVQGGLKITGANVDIFGSVTIPGGTVEVTAFNISPSVAAANLRNPDAPSPPPNSNRGQVNVSGTISTAGLVVDERLNSAGLLNQPIVTQGGQVRITAFSATLASESVIDVSGGLYMDHAGRVRYGNAGSITVKTGQDPTLLDVVGGRLSLQGSLLGYSGAEGGSLSLQALLIQVGGSPLHPATFLVQPDFFNQGGFTNFTLTGLGWPEGAPGRFVPGIYVAPGTVVEPAAESYVAVANPAGGGGLGTKLVQKPVGLRPPVNLYFEAPGAAGKDGLVVRGDIVLGEGSVIRVDPLGKVSLTGQTVAVLGSIYAPGGEISIAGSKNSFPLLFPDQTRALSTVYIGPRSVISTAGTTVLIPDAFGRRVGAVLPGGRISVAGNIVAAAGSVLDVSGATGVLDLHPAWRDPAYVFDVPGSSGLTTPLYSLIGIPTRVDSDGGYLELSGGQMLFVDSTLRGQAGGPTALGGVLSVESGRFYLPEVIPPVTDTNLVVTQSGSFIGRPLPANATAIGRPVFGTDGAALTNGGYFAADRFLNGGFDSLILRGKVEFRGRVGITARGFLSVADGGILTANSDVFLRAPYVALGLPFVPPVVPELRPGQIPFTNIAPTYGPGRLFVSADQIDLGTLLFRNVGRAVLNANAGDIRGNGIVSIAGSITLRAGQVYPTTLSEFSLFAYDFNPGGGVRPGTIRIENGGVRPLPLSAGGTLSLYASVIEQFGTLRAPMGIINLGWDGTGTAPRNPIVGNALATPVSGSITLGAGSITSVSGIDPLTGRGIVVPFGRSDGTSWLDPRGFDIAGGGLPDRSVNISGGRIQFDTGATIDLRGGGDLLAFQWLIGNGGQVDILGQPSGPWSPNSEYRAGDLVTYRGTTYSARVTSQGIAPSPSQFWTEVPQRYAVLPGYDFNYAPYSPFDGYRDGTLGVGDRVFLGSGAGLRGGFHTLLPARYALLPGAFLVTPREGIPLGTFGLADGSSFVSGFLFNDLNGNRRLPTFAYRFEVAPASTFDQRAEYRRFFANEFLTESARRLSIPTPLLPRDSGYLLFQASSNMSLLGTVLSPSLSGGRGSRIDISAPLDFVISNRVGVSTPGVVNLNAGVLNRFGAESLIVGGRRTLVNGALVLTARATNLTVDNAGSPLSGPDITLVSLGDMTVAPGSIIRSSGSLASAPTYRLTGNGTLIRVSQDESASVIRTGVTPFTGPTLSIGSGAVLSGNSVTLDSTDQMTIATAATLNANAYAINSGRISVLFDNPGVLQADPGLILSGSILANLLEARALSLLSYSSLDFYGSGTLQGNALRQITLNAGGIRGFNQGGGNVQFNVDTLVLGNLAAAASPGPVTGATGDLVVNADLIRLTANDLDIDQFQDVFLNASQRVVGQGKGSLNVDGNLTLDTPLLTATAGANRQIHATGALNLVSTSGPGRSAPSGGLGATLSLSGGTLTADSLVLLPSGSLSLRATAGDLRVGGQLNVGGTAQRFYDVIRYTNAGEIRLTADLGDVVLESTSVVNLSAQADGGNAGRLTVVNPGGEFVAGGELRARGGAGGAQGVFELDTAALPTLSGLSTTLSNSGFTASQSIRVRTGDVQIDGIARAAMFRLSADQGSLLVTGTVDASGRTGGVISLSARGDVTLASGSVLTVAGETFSSAGKGGSITLESGTTQGGVTGSGTVDLRAGATLDLSVASKVAGDEATWGSSAWRGQYSGRLHIRAPQTAGFNDVRVNEIGAQILDASSIVVEGYRVYDLTGTGQINAALRTTIFNDAQSFLGANGVTTANYTQMMNRLLASNSSLASVLVLAPGVEIIQRSGDLSLGALNSNTTADWDLSGFRFGARGAAGVLTLRAAGSINFFNALSDGFAPTLPSTDPGWLWLARMSNQNPLLPVNTQSWSYRITSGADLSASDFRQVQAVSALATGAGSVVLGKDGGAMVAGGGANATTASVIGATTPGGGRGLYQVIRTGSGNIEINAGRSVQLLNQFATIYTAGTRVADVTLGGTFDNFGLTQVGGVPTLGAIQQNYPFIISVAGGNVAINSGANIERLGASSSRQMPNNWLYRRGYVNPANDQFGLTGFGSAVASTAWWVDFSNFFQGIGALGGGDVSLNAGRDIVNVEAVIPTNARTTRGTPANPLAANQTTLELGGGDLTVRAGNNIDAGVYYVERGRGILSAGGQITTNATRSPGVINTITGVNQVLDSNTWLPTTLFLGKGGFDVDARGDLLLGPVANPFLLPVGLGNSYWNKTYFSTYSPDSFVNVSSLGGTLTLRQGTFVNNLFVPMLEGWAQTQQLENAVSSGRAQPWLRLAETAVTPFRIASSLLPGTLNATAFSGDINLLGNLTLSPAPRGNAELLARGGLNGLQPSGINSNDGTRAWIAARINLSDANPAAIPGVLTPFSYQQVVGTSANQANSTRPDFFTTFDQLFYESGATLGSQASLQVKQTLHAPGLLHRNDPTPVRLYAGTTDISGLTLFAPKVARVLAARDLTDIALYIQNLATEDISVVAAGRNILPYNPNSILRNAATRAGNLTVEGFFQTGNRPLAGDIQISGPGTLQVLAGGNLDLGSGPNNPDGTGVGITSIGNARNPGLPFEGASLSIGAGIGPALSLYDSKLNLDTFLAQVLQGPQGAAYLAALRSRGSFPGLNLGSVAAVNTLNDELKAQVALELFFIALRDAGRGYNDPDSANFGSYGPGFEAITALFGGGPWQGDIFTRERDIRTRSGGAISIFAPGGSLTLAQSVSRESLIPPGIITESGGNISIFADGNINLGISRIFTLRGGDIMIWSSTGDIAAGSSPKTVQSAPPTRVIIDPTSMDLTTDLAGLATGGGIGVLATVAGIPPGSVDLIAPVGVVDAGDAGIRATGNLNIAASAVLNAGNIAAGGAAIGTPAAPVVATPNIGGLTSAAAATGAAASATATTAPQSNAPEPAQELPSVITVEVIGYGGGAMPEDEEEEAKKRKAPPSP